MAPHHHPASAAEATAEPPVIRTVGVLSDTHGLLRPEAVAALKGSNLLLHAGDVGSPEILDRLREIAPVVAVRGNVDRGEWSDELPPIEVVDVGGYLVYMLHDLGDLDLDPAAAGFAAVVAGHSHRARIERRRGVLYLNPGSAGPRRFRLPVTVARLAPGEGGLEAQIVELDV